jgi:hypothetical protein
LIDEIDAGALEIGVRAVPLAEVESAWTDPEVSGVRTVLVPSSVGA